jgi:hypothetical protein
MMVSVKDMIEFFRQFSDFTVGSGARLAYGTRTTTIEGSPSSLTADVAKQWC